MDKKAYFFSKKSLKILEELKEEGEVHSIFDTSINILTPSSNLLTLIAKSKELYRNPISIVIDDNNFNKWKLRVGEKVLYKDSFILFSESNIRIDTTNKIIWDSSFRYLGPLNTPDTICKNLKTLKFFILTMKWDKGMLPLVVEGLKPNPYTQRLKPFIENLLNQDENNSSAKNYISLVRASIGLGDGLTPSGDDFLSGFIVILYYFNKYLKQESYIEDFTREIVELIEKKTNILSATFLKLAVEGETFFLLREVIKDLLTRKSFDISHLKSLMEFGGSSGASILAGLLFGISYVLKFLYRESKEVKTW